MTFGLVVYLRRFDQVTFVIHPIVVVCVTDEKKAAPESGSTLTMATRAARQWDQNLRSYITEKRAERGAVSDSGVWYRLLTFAPLL